MKWKTYSAIIKSSYKYTVHRATKTILKRSRL